MFLLVLAYPGCPGQTAIKWLLLLLLFEMFFSIFSQMFFTSVVQCQKNSIELYWTEYYAPGYTACTEFCTGLVASVTG